MAGEPFYLKMPKVVGVDLIGEYIPLRLCIQTCCRQLWNRRPYGRTRWRWLRIRYRRLWWRKRFRRWWWYRLRIWFWVSLEHVGQGHLKPHDNQSPSLPRLGIALATDLCSSLKYELDLLCLGESQPFQTEEETRWLPTKTPSRCDATTSRPQFGSNVRRMWPMSVSGARMHAVEHLRLQVLESLETTNSSRPNVY